MADIKGFLKNRGMKLMSDPKVAMQAFQLRGKAQEKIDENVEKVAGTLGLVTKKDVRELKRTIKKLETELKKTQDAQKKGAD